jgi:hypothetical protein
MKKLRIDINSEIKKLLVKNNIPIQDGVSYLILTYYHLNPSFIDETLINKINTLNIFTKDYTSNTITWNINLFEDDLGNFSWIKEWMDLFKKVNPARRGTKADVLKRMKDLFMNDPKLTIDEVFTATKMYFRTLDSSKFVKKSHKFIKEQDGSSLLVDFITKLREEKASELKINDNELI